MPITPTLLEAKQTLSARLLRAGLRGGVVGMRRTFRVDAAVVTTGQNVHAVGIGPKVVNGQRTDVTCVRLYVVQKIAPSLLPPRDRLPEEIDGVPTDVIESSPAFLSASRARKRSSKKTGSKKAKTDEELAAQSCTDNRRKRQRPIVAGISAAHRDVTAGTISYFCRSTRHGDDPAKVYVMSNNHVFADVNQAHAGDNLLQPGPADGGISSDHFAELHRFVEIHLGGTNPNRVDAAIGELLPGTDFKLEVCGIGKITGTERAGEGTKVHKHGRTTGYTEGDVSDESYDALVGMDHNNPSIVALFESQMRIERVDPFPSFGLGGDSGSLVVNRSNAKAVGLFFASPPSGSYGVANHIEDVLAELQVELL